MSQVKSKYTREEDHNREIAYRMAIALLGLDIFDNAVMPLILMRYWKDYEPEKGQVYN